jgi:hypothetical protein
VTGEWVGPYRVLRKLDAGGMGAVYLAEDDWLGRRSGIEIAIRLEAPDARGTDPSPLADLRLEIDPYS